jgi:hypothetical protein
MGSCAIRYPTILVLKQRTISNPTMSPKVWGPPLWNAINVIARCYPESPTVTDMRNYREFFASLANVLPCRKCQRHYRAHLAAIGTIPARSRTDLVDFVAHLHNRVNRDTGKAEMPLPAARAHIMASCRAPSMIPAILCVVVAAIFIIQFTTR